MVNEILGPSPNLYLEYLVVRAAVSRYLRNNPEFVTSDINEQHYLTFNGTNHMTANLIRQFIVKTKYSTPCSVLFWKNTFNFDVNETCWSIAKNATKESRLRELHWKIVHNIYPTNILLQKMGLSDSEYCPYCTHERDYIEHFFYDCSKVKPLWKHVENTILDKTGVRVKLNAKSVLLGVVCVENAGNVCLDIINHLVLIAKMCISKFRYGTPVNLTLMFENEMKLRVS
eukprot:GHVL01010556.1.p1 GENE.GHVL01010556.1~~GHVL01010556.1.p1  ORF type:complete len:229 (-),score=2.89 GHVL01010556.1:211-897(-)